MLWVTWKTWSKYTYT